MAPVVGRDRELEAIASFLGLEPGAARILLLDGEAGIGKTALWRAGVEAARAHGFRVLACAAAEAETEAAFTSLRDLLSDAYDAVAGELPSPQRRALDVALLREEPGARPPDRGTIATSFLSTLRLLGSTGPVLVAVDDAQWLDDGSAELLAYALRRLDSEPVGALLARRGGDRDPLALGRLELGRLQVLELGALTVGAVGRILHDRLGLVYPRPTLGRLHEVSGGNPFYALELARALGEKTAPLGRGEPLPVPGTLLQLVEQRLAALPPPTLDALAVVSALSRPTPELIAAALGLDAAPLLAPAVDAQIVEVGGDGIRFAHPLYAAAVYALAAPRRGELHAGLARIAPDVEERARHLSLATNAADEVVAQAVEEGAEAAFARGSPATAAELAAQALRLTPSGEDAARTRRTLAEVDYAFASGDTVRASTRLAEAVAATPAGPERARLLSRQARIHHFAQDIDGSVALLTQALGEATGDGALQGEIEEGLAWGMLLLRRDLPSAAAHARSSATRAERRGDRAALAEGLAAQALIEFALGRPWEETMDRALALVEATRGLRVLRDPHFAYGYCLSCADEHDRARALFEELLQRAARDGDEASVPSILNHLALIECLSGNGDESRRYIEEGYTRALESGQRPTQASILGKRALLEARRGAVDAAREYAFRSLAGPDQGFDATAPEHAMARGGETAIWALGFLELSLGNAQEADRLLAPMVEALLAAGLEEPGEMRCLPDEIEALVVLGRLDDAEALLGRLEGWARKLERPSTLAVSARCRGLVLAAQDEAERAVAALEQSAALYEQTPMPFELARTLLALGTEQRRARQRRAAHESLGRALALFEQQGAARFVERTNAELGRIGGRRPSTGELTPSERRIAGLVAEGKTNKEVAAILVVTNRTVESALTQIYRKLEVRSRTELARRLAEA